ncbi:MAG: DNA replication and repair protein RecF [Ignavibacteriaceae bacterium]
MVLSSIQLKNFRSHKNTELNFSNKLNYIVGGNGQGKTTILEAIYFLCTTKGYNSKNENEVLRFNETDFEIKGLFKDLSDNFIRIYYSKEDKKKYFFQNNKQVYKSSEVIGKYPIVILSSADHAITHGAPGERRKFVDSIISQSNETYLKILLDYNKTLRQRSSLLTQIKENKRKSLFDELAAWTLKLKESGIEIIKHRKKFVNDFNEFINNSYKIIMDEKENPKIFYTFFYDSYEEKKNNELENLRNIEKKFLQQLNEKRNEELRRAVNLVGPHRDDFIFEINGINLKTFGSQGQHKTFQIVLRFAQFFYLKEVMGRKAIFLLDDVFGELDANRATRISSYLREVGQAFITLTDFANFSFLKKEEEDLIIKVKEGTAAYA